MRCNRLLKRGATPKWGKLAPSLRVAAQIGPYCVLALGGGVATALGLGLVWPGFRSQRHPSRECEQALGAARRLGGSQLLAEAAGEVGHDTELFDQGRRDLALGESQLGVEEKPGDGGLELAFDGGGGGAMGQGALTLAAAERRAPPGRAV